jgi:hypothetical protein
MNEYSVADEFKVPVIINGIKHPGMNFELVSKPPGSRETGSTLMRERLINTVPRPDSMIREGNACSSSKGNARIRRARCRSCLEIRRTLTMWTQRPSRTFSMQSNTRLLRIVRRVCVSAAVRSGNYRPSLYTM